MNATPKSPIGLQPYRKWWAVSFQVERLMLGAVLLGHRVRIQHVGSTSVPGMIARPIIDILVGVRDHGATSGFVERIGRIGYEYRGENCELRQSYFAKGKPTAYKLYVVELRSEIWKDRTAFRDLLRSTPGIAADYASRKRQLAELYPSELAIYQKEKGEYCRVLMQAPDSEALVGRIFSR